MELFSEELAILDKNTILFMIEEMEQEFKEKLQEKDKETQAKLQERDKEIQELKALLAVQKKSHI